MSKTVSFGIIFFVIVMLLGVMANFSDPYGVNGAVDAELQYKVAIDNRDKSICDKIHLKPSLFMIFVGVTSGELQKQCHARYSSKYPN